MTQPRWLRRIVLSNAGNVADVLNLLQVKLRSLLDFTRMRVEPTRYVHQNYRHFETDVVLTVPFRDGRGHPILIYILIEHQTEPDPFMAFRVLEYVVLIYRRQMQAWESEHGSLEGFRFQPVLPIVLYTGTRTWEDVDPLENLIDLSEEAAAELRAVTPSLKPLFLNVGTLSEDDLTRRGGVVGGVLRLLESRKLRREVFEQALERALRELQSLSEAERQRWRELLAYLQALVYHERAPGEHEPLRAKIQDRFTRVEERSEVGAMARTIWESAVEEGFKKGQEQEAFRSRRETLLRLLRRKFGRTPARVVKRIESETRVSQLKAWLDEIVTAETLEAMSVARAD